MDKSGRTNIFYKVVNNENTTTELLCNLLQFPVFLNGVLKMLSDDIEFTEDIEVETQYSINYGKGYPDIRMHSDQVELLIEVKIDHAPLTDNQPKGYLAL